MKAVAHCFMKILPPPNLLKNPGHYNTAFSEMCNIFYYISGADIVATQRTCI